jgi:hypothetical protein
MKTKPSLTTPSEIMAHCGLDRSADALGVTVLRIKNVLRSEPLLPASWFACLERLAGCQLPRDQFTFKGL